MSQSGSKLILDRVFKKLVESEKEARQPAISARTQLNRDNYDLEVLGSEPSETEPRLRIMHLLLSAHPDGLVVGDIQAKLDIPNSTLSHHLEKLKSVQLVHVHRESTFLRYTANAEALRELLRFLYTECCTSSQVLKPEEIVQLRR